MKNKILIYAQTIIIIGLLALSFFQRCERKDTPVLKDCNEEYYVDVIANQTRQIDSLLEELDYFQFKLDSCASTKVKESVKKIFLESPNIKVKADSLMYNVLDTVRFIDFEETIPRQTLIDATYFKDSSYLVTFSIDYVGKIYSLDQIFSIKKYEPKFIPRTKYITKEPVILKEETPWRKPRILAGASVDFNDYTPDNLSLSLALQDNKGRMLSVSKSIVNNIDNFSSFRITYMHPILKTKR